ncbi:YwbE family protein [Methanorbis furvi]
MLDGRVRKNIRPGTAVAVVLKADQPTGALTWGRVAEILTNSSTHPHGIKVRLTNGQVGRVQQIYDDE